MRVVVVVSSLALITALPAQEPPKVVELSPPNLACDVDATKTAVITARFDRAMSTGGFSFCGGGPAFPKFKGRPTWKDERTVEVEVDLEPDHDYHLSLNCPAGQNFRAADGQILAAVPWSFSTLPAKLPDQKQQRARNQKALAELTRAVDAHYSHRDLRVKDWSKVYAAAKDGLLGAKTDKAFAAGVAAMLQPTADIHLYVRYGDATFPTGTRAVDPLFRRNLLDRYLKPQAAGRNALVGRTEDGIGYLLVGGWDQSVDLAAIDQALAGMADCKAVVIDARPNSGGDEGMAQRVAAWFVDGKKTYARNRSRTKPGKDGFGPVLERSLTGNADEKRLRCPIAVLTSRYVMSSNESFVMMLQQAADCTVVGQPTYGSSGNPKPFDLGNGVTVVIPTWQDLRLDGTGIEGEGIQPDVPVECTSDDLRDKDPILERALELLRAKVTK